MKIANVNVSFDYGNAKRRTGLNSPAKALHEALTADYIRESAKLFKGYTVAFQICGKVYVAYIPHSMVNAHLKTTTEGVLSVFCPLGKQQAVRMAENNELTFLCNASDLAKINGLTDGNRVEVILKRAQHAKFDHIKAWYEGGGECGGREVKFFNMDKSSRAQARLTNATQMEEVFGYDYSDYFNGERYF